MAKPNIFCHIVTKCDRKVKIGEEFAITVSKLYQYCLQHSDEHELPDGKKVYEIYQEKRNEGIPAFRRSAFRLVKLRFMNCNFAMFDEEQQCYKIWFYFPHTERTVPPATYYTLGFAPERGNLCSELMRCFCGILKSVDKRESQYVVVVAGEWEGNHCMIRNKRQIFIINKGK